MIIVIQCAAKKSPDSGHLQQRNGREAFFVADPNSAPTNDQHKYARPDDPSDAGISWRTTLIEYNNNTGANPLGLLPAWKLYQNPAYGRLVEKFGVNNVYILSAGWGLIAADFLTPNYDITFSQSAEAYKRRRKNDCYNDLCQLPSQTSEPVVFFGGKDYIPLFCSLTKNINAKRFLFYNSAKVPVAPGCILKRFETKTRTNWHYEGANALISGNIGI